jgi:hypothetical protein
MAHDGALPPYWRGGKARPSQSRLTDAEKSVAKGVDFGTRYDEEIEKLFR